MRKKYGVGEGSGSGKRGDYKLSKSPVGVSEVTKGGGMSGSLWLGEGKRGDCCYCSPAPSSSLALQHAKEWFRNHFQTRGLKSGGMQDGGQNIHRLQVVCCSGQLLKLLSLV